MIARFLMYALIACSLFQVASAETEPTEIASPPKLSSEDIGRVVDTLEDPARREEIVRLLRALDAVNAKAAEPASENVGTAAAQLLELLANKARSASLSAARLVERLADLPAAVSAWGNRLSQAEHRQQWMTIAARLGAILLAGVAASLAVRWLLVKTPASRDPSERPPLGKRVGLLLLRLVLDIVPIVAFAIAAYATLTFVDPRQETRLVALALINASILSRLVMSVSSLLFSPLSPNLRIWQIGDESANYIHQWTKRLSTLSIYGFFGLQAAYLLGIEANTYNALLHTLGLLLLLMLLILIAQNRKEVANAIASEKAADIDEPAPVSSFRKSLARVWHLLAGFYLTVVYAVWALDIQDGAGYVTRATAVTTLVLLIGRLSFRLTDQLFDSGLSLSEELRSNYPGLEQRLNRYFPVVRKLVKLFLAIGIVLMVGHAWGVETLAWVTEGSGRVVLGGAVHILLVLGIAFFFWEFASGWIENYLAETDRFGNVRTRSARTRTLLTVARNALLVLLSVISLLMILSEIGLDIAPLLAGAGVIGLAIGFGSQRLVQDVINGAFILFQDLMSVGDVVKLGEKAGVVEALSIRTVRLRDLGGVVHTIPFSSIDSVSNLTKEFSYHVFDIGVAYRENIDEVIALIERVGEELQQDPEIGPLILEPLEVFGLDQFGDSAIVIKGRIKTQPIKQWAVGRAFNRLIKQSFDQHDIEIPFPHQTIYFGQDKDGVAPPAFVKFGNTLADSQAGLIDPPPPARE